MSCTEFDLRDYFLGELAEPERASAARHVSSCDACSNELQQLRQMRFALESVPDQEPPQRIGFVSDKVYEPSRARRVWNGFWHSGPRLGFASAAMLSAALFALALRPAPPAGPIQLASKVPAERASVQPAVQPLIDEAVRKAVAETEARQQRRTEALLAASERRAEERQRALTVSFADAFTMVQKRALVNRASLVNYGSDAQ